MEFLKRFIEVLYKNSPALAFGLRQCGCEGAHSCIIFFRYLFLFEVLPSFLQLHAFLYEYLS